MGLNPKILVFKPTCVSTSISYGPHLLPMFKLDDTFHIHAFLITSLSPYGFDALTPGSAESSGTLPWSQEFVPLGAVALFSTCSPEYQDNINTVVAKANLVYMDFLKSDEGKGFNGQVSMNTAVPL